MLVCINFIRPAYSIKSGIKGKFWTSGRTYVSFAVRSTHWVLLFFVLLTIIVTYPPKITYAPEVNVRDKYIKLIINLQLSASGVCINRLRADREFLGKKYTVIIRTEMKREINKWK